MVPLSRKVADLLRLLPRLALNSAVKQVGEEEPGLAPHGSGTARDLDGGPRSRNSTPSPRSGNSDPAEGSTLEPYASWEALQGPGA